MTPEQSEHKMEGFCEHGNFPDSCAICLENSVKAEEFKDRKSGKPKVDLNSSFENYANSRWSQYEETAEKAEDFSLFLKDIGIAEAEASVKTLRTKNAEGVEQSLLEVGFEYVENIEVKQFFKSTEKDEEGYNLEDITFVNKTTGKVFSIRSLMAEGLTIKVNPKLDFEAWGGGSGVEVPALGRGKPPTEPVHRALWNVYKKIEPIVIMHEVAHTKQTMGWNTEERVQDERDAWRFALQAFRQLRDLDFDILPGVSNEQILSRLELGLINYDRKNPQYLPKRFSRHVSRGEKPSDESKGLLHDLKHLVKVVGGILEIAKDDPSLIGETLKYKK